ncbi:MAG: hypothetical protein ACUVQK_10920 [Thermogutta sp.]
MLFSLLRANAGRHTRVAIQRALAAGVLGAVLAAGCAKQAGESGVTGGAETVVIRPTDSAEPAQSAAVVPPAAGSSGGVMQPATAGSESAAPISPGGPGNGELVLAGRYRLTVPETWQPRRPAISMIEHELAVPAVEGDSRDGRVTFMAAGGSVEANIDRWLAQFTQPDGSDNRERAKIETIRVAGAEVHLVDISGTFNESTGPMMGNAVPRENYRMLGAIIAAGDGGMPYFIKFYGPAQTVSANAEAFRKMIEGLH